MRQIEILRNRNRNHQKKHNLVKKVKIQRQAREKNKYRVLGMIKVIDKHTITIRVKD